MKNDYAMLREVKRLKSIRGYGTELVSIYVPTGFSLDAEIARLRDEHSQSGNIKSKSTRQNVQSAIDKIIQYLRLFRTTPKNGIAVFAGNISNNQSKSDIQLFSIEPPEPLGVNIYRCDSTFVLEPLEAILDNKDTYCLVVMDGREATIATLKGTHIQIVRRLNSMAHAKVRKGGQSAQRFARGREESIHEYSVRISDVVNGLFAKNEFKIKGVIVGGPGPAKEGFVKGNTLNYQIKILGTYDTGYTDETGLEEIVEKADELLKEQEAAKEHKVIERFMQERVRRGLAVYGYEETRKALEAKKVDTLIISNELELHLVKYKCNSCNSTFEALETGRQRQEKHSDGGRLEVVEEKDMIEELVELAEASGAEIVFVSDESSYGKEFTMGYTGLGALLRYK
ncbi:MAG: peptide chain release factor aRF-1 [Candidatus Marsarchaeota archaeon]|jgi:peptide chain release factor subunit 1|nr:peptide chain release factor aRF-1 [Candidatus Marsarchaeota archaeon]